jgi:hypothetical protein
LLASSEKPEAVAPGALARNVSCRPIIRTHT